MTKQHKNLFNTREDFLQFKQDWKAFAKTKEATASDYLICALLKGTPINKAFSPVTNQTKLNCNYNGNPYFNTWHTWIRLAVRLENKRTEDLGFYNLIKNEEAKQKLRSMIIEISKTKQMFDDFLDEKSTYVHVAVALKEEAKVEQITEKKGIIGKVKSMVGR